MVMASQLQQSHLLEAVLLPVVVFSDLVVSNASMGLPWYILVVPFATEPTHNLNNLKSSHKTLTGYPACAVPVPSGLTITEYISPVS